MSFRFADPRNTVNRFARPGNALWMLVAALWLGLLHGYSWANVLDPSRSAAGNSGNFVRIPGHVLPALAKATIVPSNPKSEIESVNLTIVLKRDHQAEFERYLKDLYDPHSKVFHKFLTQSEIADRFGPSREDYNSLLRWMRSRGFRLERGSKNRLTLTMRGTRAQVESAFDVRIRDYALGHSTFFANDQDPEFPGTLAPKVASIVGLTNLPHPKAAHDAIVTAFCSVVAWLYAPTACIYQCGNLSDPACKTCMDTAYKTKLKACQTENHVAKASNGSGNDPGSWLAIDGTGQTVGLIEFDNFHTSDVSDYINLNGLPAQVGNLSEINVGGGAPLGSNEDEVLLDIDAVMTIAPGAKVEVVDGPFDGAGSFQALFNAAIDGGATVIGNSWSYCEDQTTSADVHSLDTIFQNAAVAGVSIFNATGDSGSTCLDGSANTVGVPADSPSATAVGGSSLTEDPIGVYQSEAWWNGTAATPPTGQGGFGNSKFFGVPLYQNGLTSGGRSIPDLVINADPAKGVVICQADSGGCPSGLLYGGTSVAAPQWAAFAAILNEAQGTNLGAFNPLLYPLANTTAFHNAISMGSDFAHVGLGSPNLDAMNLELGHQSVGAVDPSISEVDFGSTDTPPPPAGFPADGSTQNTIVVILRDGEGNSVGGKTVTLTASPSGTAVITPPSGVTNTTNGAVVFGITDTTIETLTLTATDTTDSIQLTPSIPPTIAFVAPPATSASINASPLSVLNDGLTSTTITVTLKDAKGNATPGKLVNIAQTGSSSINGPTPQVTDSSGNIQFTATDLVSESVTYTAVDVTDGNLPVPGSTAVDFSGDPSAGCVVGTPQAAPGFIVTPYATGFAAENIGIFSNVNFGCAGVSGIAFDSSGNLYANDEVNGNIYKFPSGGGVAGPSTQINSTSIGEGLTGLVFDSSGNLFASRSVTGGNFNTGVVLQINPSNGEVIQTDSSGLTCSTVLAIDPLSQDLFTDDSCSGSGSDNASIFRISDPSSTTPTTSVYATLTGTPNATLAFAPGGTIYAWADTGVPQITEVSGTNGPATPTVSPLGGVQLANLGLLAAGTGEGTSLIANPFVNNATIGINNVDLTTSPPSIGTSFMQKVGANFMTFGPDGCIYTSQLNTVYRITDTNGGCSYATTLSSPTLVLSPTSVSPNPAQGTSQTFNAMLHYASPLAGEQVVFNVSGANPQNKQVSTNATGQASFSYTAAHQGVDTITATTTVGSTPLRSNQAVVTWGPGSDTTFVSLNQSPKGASPGQTVSLIASLTDISQNPATALSGQTIDFSAGGQNCNAPTNAQGIATCPITASGAGSETLTASFAGDTGLLASNDSSGFTVVVPAASPTVTPATPTATPTITATPTATPTPTLTATPTATPTPVAGKLKIRPKRLNFGDVEVGSDKVKSVKITNAGKIKKKRVPLPILIEMENGATNPFSITQACDDDDLGPRGKGIPAGSCEVSVTFTPTAAQKYSGTLMIDTNLESGPDKSVKLEGVGKVPKVKK